MTTRIARFTVVRSATLFVTTLAVTSVGAGCGRKTPAAVKPTLEAHRALAIKVAEDAAKVCPAVKGRALGPSPVSEPPPPPNPAKGSALDTDEMVYDVFVTCSWPVPGKPVLTSGATLPALKGNKQMRAVTVTTPEDSVESTCLKSPRNCEQVLAPSRFSVQKASADLRVVRPIADGGDAEVVVIFATR